METRYEIVGLNPLSDLTPFDIDALNKILRDTQEKLYTSTEWQNVITIIQSSVGRNFCEKNLILNNYQIKNGEIASAIYKRALFDDLPVAHMASQVISINHEYQGITEPSSKDIEEIFNIMKELVILSHSRNPFFNKTVFSDVRERAIARDIIIQHQYVFLDLYINFWMDMRANCPVAVCTKLENGVT